MYLASDHRDHHDHHDHHRHPNQSHQLIPMKAFCCYCRLVVVVVAVDEEEEAGWYEEYRYPSTPYLLYMYIHRYCCGYKCATVLPVVYGFGRSLSPILPSLLPSPIKKSARWWARVILLPQSIWSTEYGVQLYHYSCGGMRCQWLAGENII